MIVREKICVCCRYVHHFMTKPPLGEGEDRYQCRIRAPTYGADSDGWPSVETEDWCGEWAKTEAEI